MSDKELAQIIWDYMRYEQPLEPAELIFVLCSDDIRVGEYAAELYKRGFGKTVLFSGRSGALTEGFFELSEAEVISQRAIALGVPKSAVILEPNATNTGENVRFAYELLRTRSKLPDSMILVQKPFMLRRTYATFMAQWPAEVKPKIMTTAAEGSFEDYVKDERYSFEHTVNTMVGDLQRIKEYPRQGFQIEQNIPTDVWQAYKLLVERGYTKHLLK
jgi:uncharacterized SAM-binding protein YcdF (DUF218 family)